MKNQRGQLTVEAVLILAIVMSTVYAGTKVMRDEAFLAKMVERPWSFLAGMIENGVWMPAESGRSLHPNHLSRHGSPRGDSP